MYFPVDCYRSAPLSLIFEIKTLIKCIINRQRSKEFVLLRLYSCNISKSVKMEYGTEILVGTIVCSFLSLKYQY